MGALFPHPYRTSSDTLDDIRRDLDAMLGRVDAFAAAPDASIEPEAVEALAREGRHLYTRRALELAADHAAAMLPALGLPRIVYPDDSGVDPTTAGDALEAAIAALDALDGDSDLEPYLAGGGHLAFVPGGPAIDAEDDSEEDEATALERHGCGFVASGPDDAEDDDPAEHDFRMHGPAPLLRAMVAHV